MNKPKTNAAALAAKTSGGSSLRRRVATKNKHRTKVPAIDLSVKRHGYFSTRDSMTWVPGVGEKFYLFPDKLADKVLDNPAAKKPIKGSLIARRLRAKRHLAAQDAIVATGAKQTLEAMFQVGKNHIFELVKQQAADIQSGKSTDEQLDADYRALVNGASLIQHLIIQRQYDVALESFFGNMDAVAQQGVEQLPEKYRQKLLDHQEQLGLLRGQVLEAFPKVVSDLASRNPGVPVHVLVEHAVEMIAEELKPLLQVLALYTTTIQQYLGGKFSKMLHGINAYMEALFHLGKGLPLSTFKTGDVVLTGFVGGGLGTIPAGKGALQLHLLLVQLDMQDWTGPAIPLFGHEWGHQKFSDVPGYEEEITKAVADACRNAVDSGKVKLRNEKTKLGRNVVSSLDLEIKAITDGIGEIDADGIAALLHGPSFLFTMLYSFPAMLIRGGEIKDAKKLLRTSSVYSLKEQKDGSKVLEFEPHPPDWIRVYIVAAMLENIGFKSEAERLRKLADKIVGEVPDVLTWTDAEGQSKTVVQIPSADIQALAATIAEAILRTKLKCLGGKSNADIICFTPEMQEVVEEIVAALLKGESKLPKLPERFKQKVIWENFVAAAGAKSFWDASDKGEPAEFLKTLQVNLFSMIAEATAVRTAAA
jgi:hypothetical protein